MLTKATFISNLFQRINTDLFLTLYSSKILNIVSQVTKNIKAAQLFSNKSAY